MYHRLAIIIPAYKAEFFSLALDSLAAQTCKEFTLYIGDDCSPYDLGTIVNQYKDKMSIVYHRFDSNLGGKDLVSHWERCISLSEEEDFIWLFSDDDIMSPSCVECFYKTLESTNAFYDVYHFDFNIINEFGIQTCTFSNYPQVLSSYDFYQGRHEGRLRSFVIENIFSRKVYVRNKGFVNFDLAWGSDTASWCLFSKDTGIYVIHDATVSWRKSKVNISPNKSSNMSERKIMAVCKFLEWSYNFYRDEHPEIFEINRKMFISRMHMFQKYISFRVFHEAFKYFFLSHGHKNERIKTYIAIRVGLIKR